MKKAVIEFTGTLVVYPDGDEYEGGALTPAQASGWVQHALSRGDKHAWNYTAYGAAPTSVTYEDYDEDE